MGLRAHGPLARLAHGPWARVHGARARAPLPAAILGTNFQKMYTFDFISFARLWSLFAAVSPLFTVIRRYDAAVGRYYS